MSAEHLDMTLLGKEYRISCTPETRDDLLATVAYLDDKFRELGAKSRMLFRCSSPAKFSLSSMPRRRSSWPKPPSKMLAQALCPCSMNSLGLAQLLRVGLSRQMLRA